jgi:hypothetical protein
LNWGGPAANVGLGLLVPANAVLTGHAFLTDIGGPPTSRLKEGEPSVSCRRRADTELSAHGRPTAKKPPTQLG